MASGFFSLAKERKRRPNRGLPINPVHAYAAQPEGGSFVLLPEDAFRRTLSLEKRRSERSRQRFVLMLVRFGKALQSKLEEGVLDTITEGLSVCTRETDSRGWYEQNVVVGVICTDMGTENTAPILDTLRSRVSSVLEDNLDLAKLNEIQITFHLYPEDLDVQNGNHPPDVRLYPDLSPQDYEKKVLKAIKRCIDIVGSLLALVLLAPLFLVIAIVVKLTSKGPILFRQPRLGQYGVPFTFLKFRSMVVQNDDTFHREYVTKLILDKQDDVPPSNNGGIYKIKEDHRVTPVGKVLRKTSLDELPQFFNVLKGEMSLVGPRPPIPYEVEVYDLWHRRRFLEVKPGITGLWQVEGRSRVKFDDMVRLDLKYAKTWSPWLDIKILLRTPGAIFRGAGAY